MRRISAVFAVVLAGCGSGGDDLAPCDLLVGAETDITLATVIGAGSHADGTVYLLDRAGNDYRVFVGSGQQVRRKRVAGSGELTVAGGTAVTVSVTEAEPPFRLKVEMFTAGNRMGVLRGMPEARDFVIGQQGDELTLLAPVAVQALRLQNLGGGVFVEYVAEALDGNRLVVIRPQDDWSYDDFRVFVGAPTEMLERQVDSVVRARDGGSTTIRFQMYGGDAEAFFPAPQNVNEPAVLKHRQGAATMTVTRGTVPTGFTFLCK